MRYLVMFHSKLFSLTHNGNGLFVIIIIIFHPQKAKLFRLSSIWSNLSTSCQKSNKSPAYVTAHTQHTYVCGIWLVSLSVGLFLCVCLTIHPYSMHTVGYSARCLHTIRYKSKSAASGNALESGLNSVPFPVPTFIPIPILDSVSDRTFAYRLSGVLTRQEKGRTWA